MKTGGHDTIKCFITWLEIDLEVNPLADFHNADDASDTESDCGGIFVEKALLSYDTLSCVLLQWEQNCLKSRITMKNWS